MQRIPPMISVTLLLALMVAIVVAGGTPAEEYKQRVAKIDADDAKAHYALALWCQEQDLNVYALREHRNVVVLDPEHRASRRALGYERVAGRWAKGKDAMAAKGFVEHDGVWMTKEEYAHYAKDDIAAKQAKQARIEANQALRKIRSSDLRVRDRAMAKIERLQREHRLRPLSIVARGAPTDVRLRAVTGLGKLNDERALPPLYKRAIFDPEKAVREAAVQAIKATDAKGKIGPFVKALDSSFSTVRVHAAEALGALGDAGGVGPLVRRYRVSGGSGQSVYITEMVQRSYIQDFDVEVAQTSFIADPVIGVIQDGVQLHMRVLSTSGYIDIYESGAIAGALQKLTGEEIGRDPKAWTDWWNSKVARERAETEGSGES